jgi:hypothetical protein
MWQPTESQPCPEKEYLLFFDQVIGRGRILRLEPGQKEDKYLVSDANLFFGFEKERFTHWMNLPPKPE